MRRIAFALVASLALAGCAGTFSTAAPPEQAKTVAEAIQATTLAEQSLDLYVTSGAASPAVISELKVLVPAVHGALKKVEDAQRAGNNALVAAGLAAFNQALAALDSYKATAGVK